MAVEVLAKNGSDGSCTMQLGPGMRPQRVRNGQRVIWKWPVEGSVDDEGYVALPEGWTVLRSVGGEELERRLKVLEQEPVDPQRERGSAPPEDQALLSEAIESLSDGNAEHWTKQNRPAIQAVRERFEAIEQGKTGERSWPSWITNEIVDLVGARKRGDPEEQKAS
jgi:hypothetical protein